jgi:hypothetical protein
VPYESDHVLELGRRKMKNLVGAKLVPRMEEVSPIVLAGFLGVIEPVFRNILIGHIDQAPCVVIGFGLEVIRDPMRCLGPLPLELGAVLVLINDFQGLGLGHSHRKQARE